MAKTAAFEEYSDAYDEWFERHADAYAAELRAIGKFLPERSLKGVEIGVGSGKFALPLGIETGVEPSERMAGKARKQGIAVVKGVAEDLPLSTGAFDFALMVTTICFVDDLEQSFREALRILKPGGFIVVGLVDKESRLGREYQANRHKSRFYREATFFSVPEVLEALRRAGFGTTEIVQTLFPAGKQQGLEDGFGRGAFVALKALKEK